MYKISCIHPTCRPKLARKTREKWLDLANNPDVIEYITCFDSCDKNKLKKKYFKIKHNLIEIFDDYSFGVVKKSNTAAKFSSSNCIILATDDTIPEKGWDQKILNSTDWSKEIVLNVSDGTEKKDDRLYMVKTVIVSKKRYEKLGYILHPEFDHVLCDNFHSWISHRDSVVIDKKDIMFEHLHPSIGKSDMDEFYYKASTPEEYERGEEIFYKVTKENITKSQVIDLLNKFKLEVNPIKKYCLAFVLLSVGDDNMEETLVNISKQT